MHQKILCSLLIAMTVLSHSLPTVDALDKNRANKRAKVQLAILLDTSGSMEGLIHQARTQLWKIVNDFEFCRKDKKRPQLEVALYEYGKSSLPVTEQYLRQIVPFTDDLDLLSEKLFELQTNGGEEYCGAVIQDATHNLEWSTRSQDLKLIFIAGNEPFTQGPVDFRSSCRLAVARGITVNTIHCGSEEEGRRGLWAEGARIGEGTFLNINHDDIRPTPSTPYDKRLIELSGKLNSTYVPYGAKEKQRRFLQRQQAQDANAAEAAPAVGAGRAATKGSSFYRNSDFDLLDALEEGKLELKSLMENELPEELTKLAPDKREAYLAEKKKTREAIRLEIKKLNRKRTEHLKKLSKEEESNAQFDDAVLKAVRTQAKAQHFEYTIAE
ncbi:MAG: VWA domain-containing protein [Planctomycetaceae bacterium]|nr:VWA domain-containing protein [Planctomycetaceae bacterium]